MVCQGQRRARRKQVRNARGRSAPATYSRKFAFEVLEERAMLSVSQDLYDQIAPYQSAFNTALSFAGNLPLVGDELKNLDQLSTVLQDSLADIEAATQSLANGHFEFAIDLFSISDTVEFDLGLDAFLQFDTSGGVEMSVNPVLNITFDVVNGSASLDVDDTHLDINFDISLPNFEASLSFNGVLYTKAVDDGTNFDGRLRFGFDENGDVTSEFSGEAQIRMDLAMSFVDPALGASFNPRFFTSLEIDWGFNTAGDGLEAPEIALRDFSLDADSFLQGFMADIVTTARKYTQRLQPLIDIFDTPIPIVSAFDSDETMGDLFLRGAGVTGELKDRFDTFLQIVKTINTIELGSTGGAVINFGDIDLAGDARTAGTFSFDTSQIENVIGDIFTLPELDEVQEVVESVATYAGLVSTAGFKYPIYENPGPVIGSILTGQPATMVSYDTGRLHFDLAASVGVGIPDLLGIFLTAGITFDAQLSFGYDTAGLIKFLNDPLKRPEDLLHGFYFDNSVDTAGPPIPNIPNPKKSAVYLQGFAGIEASAGVTVSGGIFADINIELASTDTSNHVHLDTMIQNLASGAQVFSVSGQVYAGAKIELSVPNPIGPDITLFEYELSRDVLLDFNPPPPPHFEVPHSVIDVVNLHSVMLDPAKMTPGGRVTVQPFYNVTLGNTLTYSADGIRVDYPNEIVFYVMRKNDVTTNFYNFVGINGATPDRVSIEVIDPFRVFEEEGVTDPTPAQTTRGVLLAGGKSAAYKYTDKPGGPDANVLLVGGYGSNTLSGGTMVFGNFIPADRIAQAKAHFGNLTGFEASTQSYINSRIDSVLLPASPAGIIGATMTSRRGGLMYGGPGNNSFFAEGPGAYEMIGGSWTNSFTISPSFEGVPATYAIDGGPFGQSKLAVRVPSYENVGFENSTLADKYDPSLKALAVTANAGLSATAHGIKKVQIIAQPGSSVMIGDTSEIDSEFAIRGGAELTFGGTSAPDVFTVTTTGPFHGMANHYSPPRLRSYNGVLSTFPWEPNIRWPDPIYTVTRTFGTNGRTQAIPFVVGDAQGSSLALNAGGASDTYNLTVGLGAFIDIGVSDSDASTVNSLSVSIHDRVLELKSLLITDNTVEFDYYTNAAYYSSTLEPGLFLLFSSVHYTPTVTFSNNFSIAVNTAFAFAEMTVDRPNATHAASLAIGGASTQSPLVYGVLSSSPGIYDASTNPHTRISLWNVPRVLDIVANAATLNISTSAVTSQYPALWFNVLDNSGDISFQFGGTYSGTRTINVAASDGNINVHDAVYGLPFAVTTTHVNVGSAGSLADITGVITLTNSSGLASLTIDDHLNPGPAQTWFAESTKTRIGDLLINHAVNLHGLYFDTVSFYQGFTKAGAAVAFGYPPPFYSKSINGMTAPTDLYIYASTQDARRGQTVDVQLTAESSIGGTFTFGGTGLPPGLSMNSFGRITGTISAEAVEQYYHATVYVMRNGTVGRIGEMNWSISSAIEITLPESFYEPGFEGSPPPSEPVTATNLFNRPVTFSASNLPPGISFNPTTRTFGGTFAPGSGQNGYYLSTITATDGVDTATLEFYWTVTGISLTSPGNQFNRLGDVIDLAIDWSISSGAEGAVNVYGLPDGLAYNPTTRRIAGTISNSAQASSVVTITVMNGNDYRDAQFQWLALPQGVTNHVELPTVSDRHLHEDEYWYFYPNANSSLGLPLTYTVTGLPPGLSLSQGEGSPVIAGTVAAGAASDSPYQVVIHATDGYWSDSTSFEITVSEVGTVSFGLGADYTQNAVPNDIVSFWVTATSTLGETITYSAEGLPPGITIDPESGLIGGSIQFGTSIPLTYQTTVTATTASGSDQTKFLWNIFGSYSGSHVVHLDHPDGIITISSPPDTTLKAMVTPHTGVPLPGGVSFPLGFIDFAIYGLEPGASAALEITGLDLTGIEDYFKYGATPNNPVAHWYNFLFGVATDGDSAIGTGMEIIGNTLVLHLIDGGRGDDDVAMNGVIFDIGGPAIANIIAPELPGDYNVNGVVDAADYSVWRNAVGQVGLAPFSGADGNGDGKVDTLDYGIWKRNFGAKLSGGGSLAASLTSQLTVPERSVPKEVETSITPTVARAISALPAVPWLHASSLGAPVKGKLNVPSRIATDLNNDALIAWLETSSELADRDADSNYAPSSPNASTESWIEARESAFDSWPSREFRLRQNLCGGLPR